MAQVLGQADQSVTSTPHAHSHKHEGHAHGSEVNGDAQQQPHDDEFARLRMFLEAHFGDVSVPKTEVPEGEEDHLLVMDVKVDNTVARIDLISMVSAFRFSSERPFEV